MSDIGKAFEEMEEQYNMLLERQPELRERIEFHKTETAKEIEEIFQPLTDYTEGKITFDEYQAIMAHRHEEDQQRRRIHYGDGESHELHCTQCGRVYEWVMEEHDDEFPPIYFECEDATGADCRDEENEDD